MYPQAALFGSALNPLPTKLKVLFDNWSIIGMIILFYCLI
jgi:hypothetical protein